MAKNVVNGSKNTKRTKESLLKPIKFNVVSEKDNTKKIEKIAQELSDAINMKAEKTETDTKRLDSGVGGETKIIMPTSAVESEDSGKAETVEPKNAYELSQNIQSVLDSFNGKTDMDFVPEEYKPKIKDSLGLSEVEVPEINEEEIKDEVMQEQTKKTESKRKETEDKINAEIEKIFEEINKTSSSKTEREAEINDIYDEYKLSQENQALKRGLTRSSTVLLMLDGIEKNRAEELARVGESIKEDIETMENEIAELTQELDDALNSLDIELGENINKEIKNRLEALEKKKNEAIEYNNSVKKMEAEYALKKPQIIDDAVKLENQLKEQYAGVMENTKREQVINMTLSYFESKPKQEALAELMASSDLARVLGDYFYDIYYLIMRRK